MSTAAIPGDFTTASPASHALLHFPGNGQTVPAGEITAITVRRRANRQQGRALEIVGHAIEYLVDSRLFITSGLDERAEQQAIQSLMRASRAVFVECAEVVPLRSQVRLWIERRLPRGAQKA